MEDSVDKDKNVLLGFRATIMEVFSGKLVDVAGFTILHFGEEYVLQLLRSHRGDSLSINLTYLKYVEVIKLTKFLEAPIIASFTLI